MNTILNGLNEEQTSAVLNTKGTQLILAGAGSGKTRTVTHKIAYLCSQGIDPKEILAITFTNKAAGEMKERINQLVGDNNDILACTFHSLCYRIIKSHSKYKLYTIYDDDEQKKIIKTIVDNNIELADTNLSEAKSKISKAKNDMLMPHDFKYGIDSYADDEFHTLYLEYQKYLENNRAFDFDDLLLKAVELFKDEGIKEKWGSRYKYIFVDEFQDTNRPQFLLTEILSEKCKSLCVVGDDNQSIYRWRGSDIDYILNFEQHFGDEIEIFKLENNYRSTPVILKGAQSIINLNSNKSNKKIKPVKKDNGHKIDLIQSKSEYDEAAAIAYRIKTMSCKLNDIAVIYRTNMQSRVLENELRDLGIPARIIGGVSFFNRKEIKDLIAYLKFIQNRDDSLSLSRIINFPNRGVGKVTLNKMQKHSKDNSISLLESIKTFTNKNTTNFINDIESINVLDSPSSIILSLIKDFGIERYWKKHKDKYIDRLGNVWEFLELSRNFKTLDEFLEHIFLQTSIITDEEADAVTLMTAHASKGLEYPTVFIVGLNEELFPLPSKSKEEIEEERRLCYVAMTRAMDRLYLSTTKQRNYFGKIKHYDPSHFLEAIPSKLIRKVFN